jgi:hypothetical protein
MARATLMFWVSLKKPGRSKKTHGMTPLKEQRRRERPAAIRSLIEGSFFIVNALRRAIGIEVSCDHAA